MRIFLACIAMCIILLSIAHADSATAPPSPTSNLIEARPLEEARAATMITVSKPDGSRQCQDSGQSLEDAVAELEEAGVAVHAAALGHDGKMRPAVCGAGTGRLLVMTISSKDRAKAEALGYQIAEQA